MGQIDNGLEMSLDKWYLDDWIVSIKQHDRSFSGTEKKIPITANTWRAFQLLEAVISSASGQIPTFWLEIFCQHQLENYLGR